MKKSCFQRCFMLLILGCSIIIANAQKVQLNNGILTLTAPPAAIKAFNNWKILQPQPTYFFAASFSVLPNAIQRTSWQTNGTIIHEKLSNGIYLMSSQQAPTLDWCTQKGIISIGQLLPALKIDPRISQGNFPATAMLAKEKIKIVIGIFGQITPAIAKKLLAEEGFTLSHDQFAKQGIYKGSADKSQLMAIAQLPFVYFIQAQNPDDKPLNDIGRSTSGTGILAAPLTLGGRNLLGQGMTIGVGDDADPTLHIDISDRVINFTPGIVNNHGTHVAGTVGGAGIRNYPARGFAPEATIISQWFSGIWQNADTYTQAYNMMVTNNSYGSITGDCNYAGVYDLESRLLDQQAFEFPHLLHAFASGNDGDNTCAPFPRAYHTVLGGYQSAKNIITVGRTDYTQFSSSSSSSGPVKDGRLKPEITGLGIIRSLNGAGTGYFTEFGTSMSAPNITGGLSLLYQRYQQLFAGQKPQGALMKALLLNGARDVGNPGPDYRHGYGTMMLERSLRMLESGQYTVRQIAQAQVQDTGITVGAGSSQLKIMLYWHDPAANVLAANTLVHDLDLEVITPSGTIVYPKILNPDPGAVDQPATEGEDHRNNHEQVLIDNPLPGNYTIRVKGTDIMTSPNQAYAIVFDKVPNELRFTNPFPGTSFPSGAINTVIAWEDTDLTQSGGTYSIDYSLDNGNNWVNIVSSLKDTTRLYFWQPGAISSNTARLRIIKGASTTISEPFAIIPNVSFSAAANADQCYGYFRINWTAIAPVSNQTIQYVIRLKDGPRYKNIDTVSNQTTYVIKGLHPDSTYFAVVEALIDGKQGVYGNAISRRPNNGNCNRSISDGDLMLDSILAPLSGRAFTSTALGSLPIRVRVRNNDNVAATAFTIKYNINGGAFTEVPVTANIAARGTYVHQFDPVDFAVPGTYHITSVVNNTGAADPYAANDTFRLTIRHLPNTPVNLATSFMEGFESAAIATIQKPEMGMAGLSHWDYVNQDVFARARTQVTPNFPLSGQKAITLDVSKSPPRIQNPFNQLIGTFNLSAYQVASSEIRLGFQYMHHGFAQEPHPLNKVWIRGSDTDPWVELYDLGANQIPGLGGVWKNVAGLPINDILRDSGQQFSSSTQVRFGQYGLYSTADKTNFAGYTFDDVALMIATNDVAITNIVSPLKNSCGLSANEAVVVRVRNDMPQALTNVPVEYRLSGGGWIRENISTIAAKSSVDFEFATKANLSQSGKGLLEVRTVLANDNIPANDSTAVELINQPLITLFPYYQDFELGDGGFVADGINSTWQYGTPSSFRIKSAASGQNAWKTRLIGNHNNNEFSYLYTPCFDISLLSSPMLNFSLAYSIEDCRRFNAVCDAAWMEYSLDGQPWQKLGQFGEGENWYDYEAGQVWMRTDAADWREAMLPLPKHNGTIKFRFVMQSDLSATYDGIAIDNFHIFNSGPLPLSWIRFDAQLNQDKKVLLNWQVSNPQAGDQFEIQLANGINAQAFTAIGITQPANGSINFSFVDAQLFRRGTLYYRIIWKKASGEQLISPVRTIQAEPFANGLNVFPNPAKETLQLQALTTTNEPVTIRLLTIEGKTLYSAKTQPVNGVLQFTIPLSNMVLPPGLYLVEMTDGKSNMVRKWMKE